MSSDLYFENKKFISAKEGAKISGYSSDYIGQLCRGKKIISKRIGKSWYVSYESLLDYIKNNSTDSRVERIVEKLAIQNIEIIKNQNLKDETFIKKDLLKNKISKNWKNQVSQISKKTITPLYTHYPLIISKISGAVKYHGSSVYGDIAKRVLASAFIFLLFFSLASAHEKVFKAISQIPNSPKNIYSTAKVLTNLYGNSLASGYISFGSKINGVANHVYQKSYDCRFRISECASLAIENSIMKEKMLVDSMVLDPLNKTLTSIKDSFGSSLTYFNNGLEKNSLAQAVSSVDVEKESSVDRVGVKVYREVNSWFYKTGYGLLTIFGNNKNNIVINNIYEAASSTASGQVTLKTSSTSKVQPTKNTNTVVQKTVVYEYIPLKPAINILPNDLDRKLQELNNSIMSKMSQLSTGSGGSITNVYNQIAQSQKIDNLGGVTISNSTFSGGTISNSTFSGGTLSISGAVSLGTTTLTNLTVSNTSTSTFAGGLSIRNLNVTDTNSTSTFANGVDLTGGCFSVDGICLSLGGGGGGGTINSGTVGQVPYYSSNGTVLSGTSTLYIGPDQKVGIGTTSPYAKLSVVGEIVGSYFTATTTATSTFSGGINVNLLNVASTISTSTFANGIRLTGGCFQLPDGTCAGAGGGSSLGQSWEISGGYLSPTTTITTLFNNGFLSTASSTIVGNATTTGSQSSGYFRGISSATSTFTGGLSTNLLNITSATASSTFANGINLTTGCFSINGTCVGAGGGSGASTTLLTDANTWSGRNTFTGLLTNTYASSTYSSFITASTTNFVLNSQSFNSLLGSGLTNTGNALTLDRTGDWTGTFDGQEGSYYLSRANQTGTQAVSTLSNYDWTFGTTWDSTNLTPTSTKPIWAQGGLNASSTSHFNNASTTFLSVSGNSYLSSVNISGTALNSLLSTDSSGNIIATSTPTFGYFNATSSSATSTIAGGLSVNLLNITSATASSTFANGINLTTGCFSINGTCVGGGGGSSASTTLLADSNTFSGTNNFTQKLGLASSSPWGQLSVNPNALGSGVPEFVIGSSTATHFVVSGNGNVGIGTTASMASSDRLTVNGTTVIGGTTNSQGTTLYVNGSTYINSVLYANNGNDGVESFSFNTLNRNRTAGTAATLSFGMYDVNFNPHDYGRIGSVITSNTDGSETGDLYFKSSNLGTLSERMRLTGSGNLGLGTTTPFALLQLSTSTASNTFRPQLALSDTGAGTNAKHWTLSSQGGNFYLASSTDTYATSSITALEIAGTGFGTTTVRGLNISGQATSTSNVGMNITTGCFSINGTCVGGGGGSSASTTLLADSNTFSGTNNFTGNVGIGTTSPYTKLGVGGTVVANNFVATTTSATSTFSGAVDINRGLQLNAGYIFGAGLTSCSGSSDKLSWNSSTGQFGCGADAGAGGGITALYAQYSSAQTGSSQIFATSSDTNIGLTITSSGDIHTFTPVWNGTLSVARGGTGQASFAQGWLSSDGSSITSSTSPTVAYITATSTATSTFSGGVRANLLNITSTTASSTFANGINLTTGCFSINGTCVGGSSASTTLLADSNTFSGATTFTGLLINTYASSTYTSFTTASTTNFILNGQLFNNLLGTGLSNSSGVLTVSNVPNASLQNSTISGIALGSSLADLTATNGTLTFSGTYNGSTARTIGLNLSNANIWTVKQDFFGSASSTLLSANYAQFGSTATSTFTTSGRLGIASSSPFARLGVETQAGDILGFAVGSSTKSLLSVSTEGFGTTTLSGLNISGFATSTSNVGMNITNGCFSINGTCVGSNMSSTTLLADSNTFSGTNNFTQKTGFATSSPFARLSVESQAGEAAFVIGSSTRTSFLVDSLGKVVIGSSSATTSAKKLYISDDGLSDWTSYSRHYPLWSNINNTPIDALKAGQNIAAILGTIDIPSGATSFSGGAGGMFFARTAASGVWPATQRAAEAVRAEARIAANGGGAFGITSLVESCSTDCEAGGTSFSASYLANEFDINNYSAGTSQATGIYVVSGSTNQATIFDGVSVSITPTAPVAWKNAFKSFSGAAEVGLYLGQLNSGASQSSQPIYFQNADSGNNPRVGAIDMDSLGVMRVTSPSTLATSGFKVQLANGFNLLNLTNNGNAGIGTSTPFSQLQIATSSGNGFKPQLSLTDTSSGTNLKHWGISSLGGNLYISTSTDAYATSSLAALTINSNGNVGIGNQNPNQKLDIVGNISANGSITTTGITPDYFMNETDAATNEKIWDSVLSNGTLSYRTINDAVNNAQTWMQVTRQGFLVNAVSFPSGKVGVGTTTPFALLQLSTSTASNTFRPQLALSDTGAGTNAKHWTLSSQGGNFYLASSTDTYATSSITALEIAGTGFGTTTVRGLNISGQATSTSNVGMNITTGCFSIGGVCLSGASTTLLADSNTFSGGKNNFTGNLSIASSSPFAQLSVHSTGGASFAIGSSTQTDFIVDANGFVGIGTPVPLSRMHILSKSTDISTLILDTGASSNPWAIQFSKDGASSAYVTLSDSGTLGWQAIMNPLSDDGSYTLGTASRRWNAINIGTGNSQFDGKVTINNRLAISTTSPWGQLSVNPDSLGSGVPEFVVGSSSATHFIINGAGNVGIGTLNPENKLVVNSSGNNWVVIDSNSGNNSGINYKSLNASHFFMGYNGVNANFSLLSGVGDVEYLSVTSAGNVGIGTTTPRWNFQVASSTAPQLVLTDSGSYDHWTFRNQSGNFYLSSSSPTTFATSSDPALEIKAAGAFFNMPVVVTGGDRTISSGPYKLNVNGITRVKNILIGELGSSFIEGGASGGGIGGNIGFQNAVSDSFTITSALNTSASNVFTLNARPSGSSENLLQLQKSASPILTISNTGNLGLGTTTPAWQLQVATSSGAGFKPQFTISDIGAGTNQKHWNLSSVGGNFYLGTSTDTYATSSLAAIAINGTTGGISLATSTAGNLKVSATGLIYSDTTSPGSASSTLLTDSNTFSGTNNFTQKLGLASSSPWGQLSVNSNALGSGVPEFVIGSSTATHFIVNGAGNVGIATTSPFAKLSVNPIAGDSIGFVVGSSTATQLSVSALGFGTTTLSGLNISGFATSTSNVGMNITTGCYAINGTCLGGVGGGSGTVNSGVFGQLAFYGANGTAVSGTSTITMSTTTASGRVGIATSTNLNATLTLQGALGTDILNIATTTSGRNIITISEWGGFVQKVSSTTALSIQMASGTPVFEVDTTSNTNSGIDITAGTDQTSNLMNLYSSGGTFLSGFTAAGGLHMNISSSSAIDVLNGSGVSAFRVDSSAKSVGIGTSTLTYNLNVEGSQASNYIQRIYNASTDTSADGLLISLGVANASRTTGNYFVGFSDGAGTVAGKIQGGASAVAYTTSAADLAEYFPISNLENKPEAGEIVTLDKYQDRKVKKAIYGDDLLGIVSTNPGFVGNAPICPVEETNCDENYSKYNSLITLAGQVPLKVTLENGVIRAGDYLTVSTTTPGVAMKATESGYVVGVALTSATSTTATTTTIIVYAEKGWRNIGSNNKFVISDNVSSGSSTSSNVFLINQKGSGDLLQVQKDGIDKMLVKNDGSIEILSTFGPEDNKNILTVKNISGEVFGINSSGDVKIKGTIHVSKNTAGTAILVANSTEVEVVFDTPYKTIPKIVVTPQTVANFFYAVTNKTVNGFKVKTSSSAGENILFDWIALVQPESTQSNSVANGGDNPSISIEGGDDQIVLPPTEDISGGDIVTETESTPNDVSEEILTEEIVFVEEPSLTE